MKTGRRILALMVILTMLLADGSVMAAANVLTMPTGLKIIEEEAFCGDTSIDKVVLPEGTTEIRARAFANSTLSEINLPDSLTYIDETAFDGLAGLTVRANAGSYGYDWAVTHGYLSESFSIAEISVDYGEIDVRDGQVYWENVPGYQNESTVTGVKADGEWTMATDETWITVQLSETASGERRYNVEFADNRTKASRTGTIRVACGSEVKTITVVQLPYLEATVISPEALARDGLYEGYYNDDGEFVDPKNGNYPVLPFEDIEVVIEVPEGTKSCDARIYTPTYSEGWGEVVSDGKRYVAKLPKEYLEVGSRELHYIYIDLYDEHDNDYQTAYAFYISGEGLNGWSVGFKFDWDTGDVLGAMITDYYGEDTEIVIPDTILGYPVVVIADEAFMGNDKITSVVIPDTVKDIEYAAFKDCTNLVSVTIPESVEFISEYRAFENCPKLKQFNAVEGSYAYKWGVETGYINTEENVVLESAHPYVSGNFDEWSYSYDGDAPALKVTFSELTNLGSYTMAVTDASGNRTEYSKRELAGKTLILEGKSFDISNVRSAGFSGAIYGFRITKVEPMSDEEYAQRQKERLFTTRTLADGTLEITDYTGSDEGDMVLPQTIGGVPVTSVAEGAFHFAPWRSVTIPEGYVSIGGWAFINCNNITSISIPASLTSIGKGAFCSTIPTRITVAEGNPAYCVEDGVLFTKDKTKVLRCTVDKAGVYAIPDSVEEIDNSAFDSCAQLTEVVIPDSVKTIGNAAFCNCDLLERVSIPSGVTELDVQVFAFCKSLAEINLSEGLTYISDDAFQDCYALTSITIPASVTHLGDTIFSEYEGGKTVDVFRTCVNLMEINVAADNPTYASLDGVLFDKDATILIYYPAGRQGDYVIPDTVTAIGPNAFEAADELFRVTIPQGVTAIERSTFSGCSGLIEITIPEGVTAIGKYAFYGCRDLPKLTIPEGVTVIGVYAFGECRSLTEITIPESVTVIEESAFYGCRGLNEVTIPKSVTVIEEYTFFGCEGLTKLTIPESVTVIKEYAFSYCGGLTEFTIPEGMTVINGYTFFGCSGLTKLTIPENITVIGKEAFRGCGRLTELVIPESVTMIEEYAFSGCYRLNELTISEGVIAIERWAFSGCGALTEVMIPESVTTIEEATFKWCPLLKTVHLPESITSIADDAFEGADDNMVIDAPEGSYAYEWAKANNRLG